MPNNNGPTDLTNAAGVREGRNPKTVPAPSVASPELSPRPQRRTFSAAAKLRILEEIERIPDRADRAIAWIELLAITPGPDAGKPLRLRPWQQDIVRGILRTDEHGRRIVRRCLVSCGRKNGKTQLIATIALLFVCGRKWSAVARWSVLPPIASRPR